MRLWVLFWVLFLGLSTGSSNTFAKLPSWEVDRLQNIFHDPSIFGGSRIGPKTIAGKYTVGVGTSSEISCAGTLIARNMVLTAGHCVLSPAKLFRKSPSLSTLRAHFFHYSKNKQKRWQRVQTSIPVSAVEIHPIWKEFVNSKSKPVSALGALETLDLDSNLKYQIEAPSFAFDLAILFLATDAPEEMEIARLSIGQAFEGPKKSCSYLVSGFGEDSTTSVMDRKLLQATYGEVDHRQLKVTELAIERTGLPSVCFGDSGGPLLENCGGEISVLGIASHLRPDTEAKNCEDPVSISVHSPLHRSMDWILQQLQKNDKFLRL